MLATSHPPRRCAKLGDHHILFAVFGLISAVLVALALIIPRFSGDDVSPAAAAGAPASVDIVALLREGILPAQLAFQASRHVDRDGDGIGDFATFRELVSGSAQSTVSGRIATLTRDLFRQHQEQPVVQGYRFRMVVEDDRNFVVYARSIDGLVPRPAYALTVDGSVYVRFGGTTAETDLWARDAADSLSREPGSDWQRLP